MAKPAGTCPTRSPGIVVMQCPVAGFQFHGGDACWSRLRVGDALALQREPGNRHDPRAVTVQWQGVMLGYVPREANFALAQMMDRGARAEGRVSSLREGSDPWQRVMMEVKVAAPVEVPCEPPKEPEGVALCAPLRLAPPPLQLARVEGTLSPAERDACIAVLREAAPELAARLARPVLGFTGRERREVRLWDAIALGIGAGGRGLVARYLHEPAPVDPPKLSLDLKVPLSDAGWVACFVQAMAALCARHGLPRAKLREPVALWITGSLALTFRGLVDFDAVRKAALEFLAPEPLARSLTNRICGPSPTAEAFNWVCGRTSAVALVAVEQPAMLPFLRLVEEDRAMRANEDPLEALHERLLAEGLEPAAWKKIPRWGFGAFEAMGQAWCKPIPFARYANLLHRMGVHGPPPREFALYALRVARHREPPNARLDLERHPRWFMQALFLDLDLAPDEVVKVRMRHELPACLDWLIDARPRPDANQQRAGWRWIVEQACAWHEARALARAAPWKVPVAGMMWGPYRVEAIASAVQLAAEARAMKNCLESYEEACRSGEVVVYSIRERSTGARVACFAAERDEDGTSWSLVEAARKMNAPVDEALERIAHAMVVKLNGGRGGDVPPF